MKLSKQQRKTIHRAMAGFWLVMAIPTLLWWSDSVLWVAVLSLYANIEASLSASEAV